MTSPTFCLLWLVGLCQGSQSKSDESLACVGEMSVQLDQWLQNQPSYSSVTHLSSLCLLWLLYNYYFSRPLFSQFGCFSGNFQNNESVFLWRRKLLQNEDGVTFKTSLCILSMSLSVCDNKVPTNLDLWPPINSGKIRNITLLILIHQQTPFCVKWEIKHFKTFSFQNTR